MKIKKLKFEIELTEAQVDTLLDVLNKEEVLCREESDRQMNSAECFADFLRSHGNKPLEHDIYRYHLETADRLKYRAWCCGDIFDVFATYMYDHNYDIENGDNECVNTL